MKGQDGRPRPILLATLLALTFSLNGCKLEEALLPTGGTGSDAVSGDSTIGNINSAFGVTAPIIADPLPGSTVSVPQPSLTVLNSAHEGGSAPDLSLSGLDGIELRDVDRAVEPNRRECERQHYMDSEPRPSRWYLFLARASTLGRHGERVLGDCYVQR